MNRPAEWIEFVETSAFTWRVVSLDLEGSLRSLQLELAANPLKGKLDPGTGGLRKVRMADPGRGKGKRGGARVHYLWLPQRRRVGMKQPLFSQLMESLGEALEHARGKRELRTTVLPRPPRPLSARDVRRLRSRASASQAVFARWLNVSTKLVQAWESGRRAPEGPALLLLRLMERHPEDFLKRVYGLPVADARQRRSTRRAAAKRQVTNAAKVPKTPLPAPKAP